MALGQSIRSFDKVLEESQLTGELRLGGRALKELPSIAARYSVRDILVAGERGRASGGTVRIGAGRSQKRKDGKGMKGGRTGQRRAF